ncbi:mRNA (2'-O-methyladenosine-N(6)-)-methyltransferase [Perkinsus olseni]|uniref:mRNA (2'-O-methyladenosine-N(6)-)-methyltransferase n=1 Tax=Perkinsus olseni TaxID=32597 RepID=A0A7J6LN67_PEROL|nr:mRNA (2'-O-methyladenosine-N(6)-)-methyltransferase [Perkinsus olseni]
MSNTTTLSPGGSAWIVLKSSQAPNESFNAWLFAALAEPDAPLACEEREHLFVEVSQNVPAVSPIEKYLQRSGAKPVEINRDDPAVPGEALLSRELEVLLREGFARARSDVLVRWPGVIHDFLEANDFEATVERSCPRQGRIKYALVLPTEGLPKELEGFVIHQPMSYDILAEYDDKLRERYRRESERGTADMRESIDVSQRIWLLLHRYNTLFGSKSGEGRGWQLATPAAAMELMKVRCDVTHECFASPLNATMPSFCSLFYDTDRFFGSVGSFFRLPMDQFPQSCEIGPPYEPGLMLKAVRKVERILAQACKTFVFVVPDWEDCESIDMLKRSKYNVGNLSLKKEEHRYKNGFQHMVLRGSLKHSMCETPTLIAWLSSSDVQIAAHDCDEMRRSWQPKD